MEFKKTNKLTNGKNIVEQTLPSNIILNDRKNLNVTGVLELYSSGETEIKLKTGLGNLKITGANLKPERLDLEAGVLDVSGDVDSILYYGVGTSKSFLKRIFK